MREGWGGDLLLAPSLPCCKFQKVQVPLSQRPVLYNQGEGLPGDTRWQQQPERRPAVSVVATGQHCCRTQEHRTFPQGPNRLHYHLAEQSRWKALKSPAPKSPILWQRPASAPRHSRSHVVLGNLMLTLSTDRAEVQPRECAPHRPQFGIARGWGSRQAT